VVYIWIYNNTGKSRFTEAIAAVVLQGTDVSDMRYSVACLKKGKTSHAQVMFRAICTIACSFSALRPAHPG